MAHLRIVHTWNVANGLTRTGCLDDTTEKSVTYYQYTFIFVTGHYIEQECFRSAKHGFYGFGPVVYFVRAFRISIPVNGPQSRSRRRGVDSRGRPCGSFSIIAVSIQRLKSLHNKASKRIFFNLSRRACACAIPSCDKCPGMCPCRMWAAFSSVCPCLTR